MSRATTIEQTRNGQRRSIRDVASAAGIEAWRFAHIEAGSDPSEWEVRAIAGALKVDAEPLVKAFGDRLLTCPHCESTQVTQARRARTQRIGSREVLVKSLEWSECKACGESWINSEMVHAAELRAALLVLLRMQDLDAARDDEPETLCIMLGERPRAPLDDTDVNDIRRILGMTVEEMRAEFGFEPTTSTDEERERARSTLHEYVTAARYHCHLPSDLDAGFDAVLEDKAPSETPAKKWAAVQYARPVDPMGVYRRRGDK